jgi:hypothetical protein
MKYSIRSGPSSTQLSISRKQLWYKIFGLQEYSSTTYSDSSHIQVQEYLEAARLCWVFRDRGRAGQGATSEQVILALLEPFDAAWKELHLPLVP